MQSLIQILQKDRWLSLSQLIFLPGVKRLFDLIKVPDQSLRSAWFYALGNTLVANDLQQASRIAYGSDKRFSRVVTLKASISFVKLLHSPCNLVLELCQSRKAKLHASGKVQGYSVRTAELPNTCSIVRYPAHFAVIHVNLASADSWCKTV